MEFRSLSLLLITFFVGLLSFARSNTNGFLNINCGAIDNVTDKHKLRWIPDFPFIRTRNVSTRSSTDTHGMQFLSLAYFPNMSVKKYCYLIPVKPHLNYLVRASFLPDYSDPDYSVPLATFFDLLIEGIKWTNVDLSGLPNGHYRYHEIILAAKSDRLSLCLARNSQTEENHFVFISSIELRPLESSMYNSTDFQKSALDLIRNRIYFDTSSDFLQYPEDPFDRIWSSIGGPESTINITVDDDHTSSLVNKPPPNLLRTAIAMETVDYLTISDIFEDSYDPGIYSFALYFCNLNQTKLRQRFAAFINEYQISDFIELKFLECYQANKDLQLDNPEPIKIILHPSSLSQLGPSINGAEMYRKLETRTLTYTGDVVAIRKIADAINVPDDWTGGDPCLPAKYSSTGITCSQDDPPRVIIIDLKSMNLEGTIPSNIADLTALQQLLLGSNNLSGDIPDLSSLKNLRILQLQNNQLTGEIPTSLEKLRMLNQLYLQDNKLKGTVSKGLVRSSLDLRVDPQNNIQNNIPASSHKIKVWVVGLLIGCSVVLVLVIFSVILLWRRKHASQQFSTTHNPNVSSQHIFGGQNNQNDYHRLAIEYTERDIRTSTNNYSTLIGKGSFGSVFYGRLSGFEVAVKILKTDSNQGHQEFQTEVAILSRIYHRNLVNLIGYCKQTIMALVYEYMPYGTLTDHLYGAAKLKTPLDWHTRLNIARQAADGLLYLHQGCYPPIIHRDIKCNNILLDNKMYAKLADFGISKLVESSIGYISTEVKGTMGYLDPEYFATSSLNEKSDVYSFGVVLLEIISGVSPKEGIVQSAHKLLSCGKLAELMDSSLGGQYDIESAWKVAEVAYMCTKKESTNRPKMSAVVKELEEALTLAFGDKNYASLHSMASFNVGDMPSLR